MQINIEFLRETFPDKEDSKLEAWLQTLHAEEVTTVAEATPLLQTPAGGSAPCAFDQLTLPLAVKAALKAKLSALSEGNNSNVHVTAPLRIRSLRLLR